VLAEDDEQLLAMVRLRLTNSSLVSELGTFLQRCECDVEQLGPRMLDVGVRHEINSDEWTRMEVEAYVKVWQALHPEGHVELVT
jgi:hypothetical protein